LVITALATSTVIQALVDIVDTSRDTLPVILTALAILTGRGDLGESNGHKGSDSERELHG
jgi:hypothetical protein